MSLYADDTAVFDNNVSLLKVQENLQKDFFFFLNLSMVRK